MASFYCFTGERGCPTRLILTFKDDALRSPPAVCAIKVPKPATLFDRITFLLQLQKMFGTFNVLMESCTRMLRICTSTLDQQQSYLTRMHQMQQVILKPGTSPSRLRQNLASLARLHKAHRRAEIKILDEPNQDSATTLVVHECKKITTTKTNVQQGKVADL